MGLKQMEVLGFGLELDRFGSTHGWNPNRLVKVYIGSDPFFFHFFFPFLFLPFFSHVPSSFLFFPFFFILFFFVSFFLIFSLSSRLPLSTSSSPFFLSLSTSFFVNKHNKTTKSKSNKLRSKIHIPSVLDLMMMADGFVWALML